MASKDTQYAKAIIDTVQYILNRSKDSFTYDRSKKGVIETVNEDGTVNVKILNEVYENVRVRTGLTVNAGNIVWVLFPMNSTKDMYVNDVII